MPPISPTSIHNPSIADSAEPHPCSIDGIESHLDDILNQIDKLMGEYVDPQLLDPENVIHQVDLTLKELEGLEAPSGLRDLLTTIVDNFRLVLTSFSVVLASLLVGVASPFVVPLMGVTLFLISAVAALLAVAGIGVCWAWCGESLELNSRLNVLSQLRNSNVISLNECWELRKESSNKWSYREHVGDLVARLSHENQISQTERDELTNALNRGTWSIIDEVLIYVHLRATTANALQRQAAKGTESVWPEASRQFVQDQIAAVSNSGEWRGFLGGSTAARLRDLVHQDEISTWLDALLESLEEDGDYTLHDAKSQVTAALRNEDRESFRVHFQEMLNAIEASDIDTAFLPGEHRAQFVQTMREVLREDSFASVAEKLSYWKNHHRWYMPIQKLFENLRTSSNVDVEAITEKLDAFAQGYLCFLMEQQQMGVCPPEEGKRYFDLFFGKWWNQMMFQLIQRAVPPNEPVESIVEPTDIAMVSNDLHQGPKEETNVLILLSIGGGGHISAGDGKKEILEAESKKPECKRDYKVEFADAHQEIFIDIDFLEKIFRCFGVQKADGSDTKNGEDFYNDLLQGGWSKMASLYIKLGVSYYSSHRVQLEQLFEEFLDKRKQLGKEIPDIVISNMPAINGIVAAVCHRRGIPFLVATTDLDTTQYVNCMSYPDYDSGIFKYAVGYPDYPIFNHFSHANIKPEHIEVTGFPLKPDCFVARDRTRAGIEAAKIKIQQPYTNKKGVVEDAIYIPPDKKTIVLSMGSQGSTLVYDYLETLTSMGDDFHIIVLCGRNPTFKTEVESRFASYIVNGDGDIPSGVTVSTSGFSTRVSDVMAGADLFIGKPGPNTNIQAMHIGLPVLIENTCTPMQHEKATSVFAKANDTGTSIDSMSDLPHLVRRYLGITEIREEGALNEKIEVIKSKKFITHFPVLVEKMLRSAEKLSVEKIVNSVVERLEVSLEGDETFFDFLKRNKENVQALMRESLEEHLDQVSESRIVSAVEHVLADFSECTLKAFIRMSPSFKSTLAIKLQQAYTAARERPKIVEMINRYVETENQVGFEGLITALTGLEAIAYGVCPVKEVLVTLLDKEVRKIKDEQVLPNAIKKEILKAVETIFPLKDGSSITLNAFQENKEELAREITEGLQKIIGHLDATLVSEAIESVEVDAGLIQSSDRKALASAILQKLIENGSQNTGESTETSHVDSAAEIAI